MSRKHLLFGLLIAVLFLTGCQRTTAWWKMDETSGTRMNDSAGTHVGTLHNVQFSSGRAGGAYRFNGTTSYVDVPDASDLDPGPGDFAYSAWINTTKVPPANTSDIMRKGLSTTPGGDYKMELFPVNGAARARCVIRGSAGQATAGGGNNLQDGRWHQITCTRTGNTLSLAIDGTTVKSTTATIGTITNSAGVVIGAKSAEQDYYSGLIDDVRVTLG